MRRKSERTATKKAKPSPEKKVTEKLKRTRTSRRRKQSASSEESADETSPVQEPETNVVEQEKKPPQTPTKEKEVSPEDGHEVWTVKTAEARGDTGEIQKLKICLTRPPSTPERADRSPRSKRKHSRATSSSDTPSVEAPEERKKTKHRSKRAARESKDEPEKTQDSQGDEVEADSEMSSDVKDSAIAQSDEAIVKIISEETPISTTNDESKTSDMEKSTENDKIQSKEQSQETEIQGKPSDADTTVASPKDTTVTSPKDTTVASPKDTTVASPKDTTVASPKDGGRGAQTEENKLPDKIGLIKNDSKKMAKDSHEVDKGTTEGKPEEEEAAAQSGGSHEKVEGTTVQEVSKCEDKSNNSKTDEAESSQNESQKATNDNDVVDSSEHHKTETNSSMVKKVDKSRDRSRSKDLDHLNEREESLERQSEICKGKQSDCNKVKNVDSKERRKSKELNQSGSTNENKNESSNEKHRGRELEGSDSTQSTQDETSVHNGQAAPIVVSRKRRWGSRPSKLTTQKSITISSDVLKDIIPDVKPVEFEEVIEEKKQHKRVQSNDKVERPILPKIVIDNTNHMEHHKKGYEERDRDSENFKSRESLAANRRISIVKENDSIITHPPSPPRHKQSCILYITNLVRPFTLPQLKNLLQRTGRISEDGFWIDRIKSKCFVKYESEDQAVETRHALHGVTWPVSNPKTLQVDFSSQEAFDKAKANEDADNAQATTMPGTVEDWLREQDMKREKGELDKPWERKAAAVREWDFGKNDKDKDKERPKRDDRIPDKRRHRTPDRSPEPAKKFKKKEEEAPAKLLDDLFRKTKTTPCIYWLPLSAEMIAIKEEQRRQHMAEHERRLQELRRTHRRH